MLRPKSEYCSQNPMFKSKCKVKVQMLLQIVQIETINSSIILFFSTPRLAFWDKSGNIWGIPMYLHSAQVSSKSSICRFLEVLQARFFFQGYVRLHLDREIFLSPYSFQSKFLLKTPLPLICEVLLSASSKAICEI